jgi:hypothetical protein
MDSSWPRIQVAEIFAAIVHRKHRGILGPNRVSFAEVASVILSHAERLGLSQILSPGTRQQLRPLLVSMESPILEVARERIMRIIKQTQRASLYAAVLSWCRHADKQGVLDEKNVVERMLKNTQHEQAIRLITTALQRQLHGVLGSALAGIHHNRHDDQERKTQEANRRGDRQALALNRCSS